MMYIRKRPKEKGLLETKHEFKIFEVGVCFVRKHDNHVFHSNYGGFQNLAFRFRCRYIPDERLHDSEMWGTETDFTCNRQLFRVSRVISLGQLWLDKARKSENTFFFIRNNGCSRLNDRN